MHSAICKARLFRACPGDFFVSVEYNDEIGIRLHHRGRRTVSEMDDCVPIIFGDPGHLFDVNRQVVDLLLLVVPAAHLKKTSYFGLPSGLGNVKPPEMTPRRLRSICSVLSRTAA